MLDYTRFVRKGHEDQQPIEWIEVLLLDQLEVMKDFENMVDQTIYNAQPEVEETCNKNLTTPLASFHSFMKIILTSIIPNTTEYLRILN